jgi:hypothetical protein
MSKRKYDEIENSKTNDIDKNTKIIKVLKNNISLMSEDIALYLRKVRENQKEIEMIQNLLYEICEHNWERDYTIMSEHSEYICKKCNCYR